MKTLELNQMENVEGGSWWGCAAAIAGTGLFLGGLFVTSGPIGLYVANAVLGPTISGIGLLACVPEKQ